MKSNLFIPTKLKIGFQERHDTFTGKLAYVIYYDEKGKLRKETSWNQWRDDSIDVVEIDNTPTSGFTMNKGFTRYSDWGSGRAVIRIWDPRDFEFEIALDNLVGILMHSNVSKREIDEKCVFAWNGTELVLLPCNTEEYQSSVKYTEKQAKTFSAKTLVPGYIYIPKKEDKPVIYLGRYDRYERRGGSYSDSSPIEHKGKKHWFCYVEGNASFFTKEPAAYLATVDGEEVHTEYADKLEKLHSTYMVQKITGFVEKPNDFEDLENMIESYDETFYVKESDGIYTAYHISLSRDYQTKKSFIKAERSCVIKITNNGSIERNLRDTSRYNYNYYSYQDKRVSSFGVTLLNAKNKDWMTELSTFVDKGHYFSYLDKDKKAEIVSEVRPLLKQAFPNAVSLHWILENGKETKGLY